MKKKTMPDIIWPSNPVTQQPYIIFKITNILMIKWKKIVSCKGILLVGQSKYLGQIYCKNNLNLKT